MNANRIAASLLVLALFSASAWAANPAPRPDPSPAVMDADEAIADLLFVDDAVPPDPGGDPLAADMRDGELPGMAPRGPGMGRGGPGMRAPGPRGPGMGASRLRGLDLSREQRDRLTAIRDARERSAVRMGADMRIAQLDLRKLMRADRPDRNAILEQAGRLAQLRAELMKSRIDAMLDAREVLTPAQRERLRQPPARGVRDDEGVAPSPPAERRR